ncbi:MAG TPA: acetyl-CoA carboxylase, carboxyltransferase subunit beta [Thermomicrobiales bacterium]|nr:acetyl-CoA carboxylase, carboxyltransferase subunit beta [Thermomicrobiales bacterium]
MRNFFQRQGKFRPRDSSEDDRGDQSIPEDLWVKCPKCNELIYSRELDRNMQVCPKCDHHFRLRARQRIGYLADPGTFIEWDLNLRPEDPLHFVDGQGPYDEKIVKTQQKTGEIEALITGECTVDERPLVIMVADFDFLGASMGSVWGEKMSRAVERAIEKRLPVLTVNASGGARMHEGLYSLMQMAKTVSSFDQLGRASLPHFSLLVDPCYGGVTASYATVADVILAEPGAKIGFAGQRVIEQAIKQKLPKEFQTAEFMLEHGTIDFIANRQSLKQTITTLIDLYHREPAAASAPVPEPPAKVVSVNGRGSQAARAKVSAATSTKSEQSHD